MVIGRKNVLDEFNMAYSAYEQSKKDLKDLDDRIFSREEILNGMHKIYVQRTLRFISQAKDDGLTKREISRNFRAGNNQLPEKLRAMHREKLIKRYLIKTNGRDRIAYFSIDGQPKEEYDFVEIPYNENEEY